MAKKGFFNKPDLTIWTIWALGSMTCRLVYHLSLWVAILIHTVSFGLALLIAHFAKKKGWLEYI